MADDINTVNDNAGIFVRAIAEILEDECHLTKSIAEVPASELEGKNGFYSGQTLNISIPARKQPVDGFDITSADMDVNEENVQMTVDIEKTIPFDLDSKQLATDVGLKQSIKRFAKPFASDFAQAIEQEHLLRATQATANLVGTAGSTGFTVAEILAARTRMNKYLAPKDKYRHLILDSEGGAEAVDARKALFNAQGELDGQYVDGVMGKADGFMWHESELIHNHTNGNDVTGVNVDGASQTGAALNVQGLTTSSGTVTKGSVFTIAGVFAVHPITKATLNHLQQFTVLENETADGSGDAELNISPAIVTTGTEQNVSAGPADTAAITFVGSASTSYLQGLAFHKEAFRRLSVPLEMPKNAEFAAQYTTKAGITLSLVRDFDVFKRRWVTRLDYLGGFTAVRPEHACRITY